MFERVITHIILGNAKDANNNLTKFEIVALDCSDPDTDDILAWSDAFLWAIVLLYLFFGLFIICEHYFVPALERVGNGLGLSESVQGASLMAAGSSFPELLTALVGVIFFTDENPGPTTNVGSAMFNLCVIIGLSLLVIPSAKTGETTRVSIAPFVRDCTFFATSIAVTYLFYEVIGPGILDWKETLILALMWITYIIILLTTEKMVQGIANKIHKRPTEKDYDVISTASTTDEENLASAVNAEVHVETKNQSGDESSADEKESPRQNEQSLPLKQRWMKIYHWLSLPFLITFKYTVPNPKNGNMATAFAFILSIVWLGVFTFVIGETHR